MKEIERLVIDRGIEHNGNPVLAWQIGHTSVEEKNANIRPVKPERDEYKKIDGVVASIMAVAGCLQSDDGWFDPKMLRDHGWEEKVR